MILTGSRCKIRFIYVSKIQLQKKKSGGKWKEISAIKGGGRRLMANAIKNFHIFFMNLSLTASTQARQRREVRWPHRQDRQTPMPTVKGDTL